MKHPYRKAALAMAVVLAGSIMAPAAAPAHAAAQWALQRTSKILYLNADNSSNTKNVYDFDFVGAPAGYTKDNTFKWSSSDSNVATVATGGVVTAKNVGKTTITCVVTNKRTGKTVSTVSSTVTVKENAKAIMIVDKSKNEYKDGTVLPVGEKVVDLDRLMFNANGDRTNVRGELVTDYTKWTSSDESIATVDKNGIVTTYKPGTVTITASTYQSSSYPELRVSDTVTFKVETGANMGFTVNQATVNTAELNFNGNVSKDFSADDVSLTVNMGNTPIKVDVAEAKVDSTDASKVIIKTYVDFFEDYEYTVKVGDKEATFVASIGYPVLAVPYLYADGKDCGNTAIAEKEYTIRYHLYNENGVDISNADGSADIQWDDVEYDFVNLSDNFLLISEEGKKAVFTGQLYTGQIDDNGEDITVSVSFAVESVKQPSVTVSGITHWSIVDDETLESIGYDAYTELLSSSSDKYPQVHKVAANDGYKYLVARVGKTDNTSVGIESISFRSSNDEIITIDDNTGYMHANQEGTAVVIVYYEYYDEATGETVKKPVDTIKITVSKARALSEISLDKTTVTLSTSESIKDEADIIVTAKDTLGDVYAGQEIVVTSSTNFTDKEGNVQNATAFFKNTAEVTGADGKAVFTIAPSNSDVASLLGTANSKTVTYTITAGNITKKVSVTFKNASGVLTYKLELGGTTDGKVSSSSSSLPATTISMFSYANGVKKENVTEKMALVTGSYASLNELAQTLAGKGYEFFAVLTKGGDVTADIDGYVEFTDGQYVFNLTSNSDKKGAAISSWDVTSGSKVEADKDIENVVKTIANGTYTLNVYQIKKSETSYTSTGGYYTSKLSSSGLNFTTNLTQDAAKLDGIFSTTTSSRDIIEILKDTMKFKIGSTVISKEAGNFDTYSWMVDFTVTGSKVYIRSVDIYEPIQCADGITVHVAHRINVGKTITLI